MKSKFLGECIHQLVKISMVKDQVPFLNLVFLYKDHTCWCHWGYQIAMQFPYTHCIFSADLSKNSWRLQTNTKTQTTVGIPPACMMIKPCFLVISEWMGKQSINKLQEAFLTGPIQASILSVLSTWKTLLKMRATVVSFHWRDGCDAEHSTTDSMSLVLSTLGLTAYIERSHVVTLWTRMKGKGVIVARKCRGSGS